MWPAAVPPPVASGRSPRALSYSCLCLTEALAIAELLAQEVLAGATSFFDLLLKD